MPDRNPWLGAESIGPDPFARSNLTESTMPLDPAFLRSIGKPISELLGMVFTTAKGSGLPARLRLTNWDADKAEILLHDVNKIGTQFAVKPTELDQLINAGHVDIQQPSASAVEKTRRALSKVLK